MVLLKQSRLINKSTFKAGQWTHHFSCRPLQAPVLRAPTLQWKNKLRETQNVPEHFTKSPGKRSRLGVRSFWPNQQADSLCCPRPAGQPRAPPAAAPCPGSPPWPRREEGWPRCSCPPRWDQLPAAVTPEPPASSPSSSPSSQHHRELKSHLLMFDVYQQFNPVTPTSHSFLQFKAGKQIYASKDAHSLSTDS